MAATRERDGTPLIDLVATAISPVLIMLMVGSLTFFLVEVLYAGKYSGRLLYTFFFFVIGAVLIARISINFGRQRAMIYVAGLGGAVFLAMLAFVEYPNKLLQTIGPVINIGLMALIWWAANKLTWDCTHLDGEREAGGRGLLAATGISSDNTSAPPPPEPEAAPETGKKKKKPQQLGWLDKYKQYSEEQKKKPHTPGTWVIYFGLAAVPIFILGQSLISPEDSERRRASFMQMAVFVGSGLGLLVTTSLMGLRKYLEDRGAKVPQAMTAAWLGMGAVLILGFIVLGAILPRPHSETPLINIAKAGKQDRKASKNAVVKDENAGKGEGAAGQKKEAGDGKGNAKGGKEGGNAGKKNDGGGKGENSGGKQKSNDGQNGKNPNDNNKQANNDKNKDNEKQAQGPNKKNDEGQGDKASDEKTDGDPQESDSGSDAESSSPSKLTEALEKVTSFIKWIVWVVIAVAVIFGIIIFLLRYLAPFTQWARGLLDWLSNLFGRKKSTGDGDVTTDEVEVQSGPRLPGFDEFSNPFRDGTVTNRDSEELVGYTYQALESWAADQGEGKAKNETASEFVDRLVAEYPQLETAKTLAALVTRMAYSPLPLPPSTNASLKATWKEMEGLAPVRR